MAHILEAERINLNLRLLAIAVAAAVLYNRQAEMAGALVPAIALVLAYLIYALSLTRFIIPRFRTRYLVYGMIVVDVAVLLPALRMAGGLESSMFIFFPVLIILYSIYLDYLSSFFAATVVSLSLLGYSILTQPVTSSVLVILAFQVALFYLLAYLSGFLARKEAKKAALEREMQEQEERRFKEAISDRLEGMQRPDRQDASV